MTINDMHITFYQYAQQMGMQNVRAILPKQVDILLNSSISDIVNQLIKDNVGTRKDRAVVEPTKIGQTNALRPLYKTKDILIDDTIIQNIDKSLNKIVISENFSNYLALIDCYITYNKNNKFKTVPVRIIDLAYLSETLNDYILKPTYKSPIAVVYNTQAENINNNNVFTPLELNNIDLYVDNLNTETDNNNNYLTVNSLPVHDIKISYIASPRKIKFDTDVTSNNNDKEYLDLPASLHDTIVKHAVELYKSATSKSSYPFNNTRTNPQAQE